ncbi:hypothetical protein ISCGN_032064 [Ixodes scapularis]
MKQRMNFFVSLVQRHRCSPRRWRRRQGNERNNRSNERKGPLAGPSEVRPATRGSAAPPRERTPQKPPRGPPLSSGAVLSDSERVYDTFGRRTALDSPRPTTGIFKKQPPPKEFDGSRASSRCSATLGPEPQAMARAP